MPKKWVRGGLTPEGSVYLVEEKVPRPKKTGQPEPPPNFLPEDLAKTSDEEHPPIISFVQGVSQALEKKEK